MIFVSYEAVFIAGMLAGMAFAYHHALKRWPK